MSAFEQFKSDLERNYAIKVKYKTESMLMKVIAVILWIFNRKFMTDYVTTIGNTVYFPNKEYIEKNPKAAMAVLAHEVVHIDQADRYGSFLFSVMYLFPQILAVLALLAIFAVVWLPMLWFLAFLVFLAPFPAPWRAKFEFEGYTMSLFVQDLLLRHYGYPDEDIYKDLSLYAIRINKNYFKGRFYYFMWPFGLEKDFTKKIEDIRNGVIVDTSKMYGRVARSYLNAVSAYEL